MTDRQSNVREQIRFYQRIASDYERSIWMLGCRDNRNHAIKIRRLGAALRASDAGSILEVGTGTGLHAKWILEHTQAQYTGVDASSDMLAIARTRLEPFRERARLGVVDGHRLPFADATFDAVFCSGTLHHLSDPSRGIAEMVRVLRPGGRFAAMEPNWKFPSTLVYITITREEWNNFKINPERLAQWARGAGLQDVRVDHVLYTPPKPVKLLPVFDRLDARIARVPGLRKLSINLLVSGRR